MGRKAIDPVKRFWPKVNKTADCWLWTGEIRADGYGVFSFNGRQCRAHRVAWELTHGPIPAGKCVLHRCDIRHCVNPDHLWLGTRPDNNRDMFRKNRNEGPPHRKGEGNPAAKLTPEEVRAIRRDYATGKYSHRQLRQKYRLGSKSTIGRIIRGENWKHIPEESDK